MKKKHIHDSGYKLLFSNPNILKDLLENFVALPFVKQIDFDKAEMLNTSFIDEKYAKKESDVIYKLESTTGEDIYIYVLIEFQSSVDKFMSFRMLRYLLEFYEYLLKQNGRKKKFPPVLPIILYNGDKKWTAPENIKDLIDFDPTLTGVEQYFPSFKYLKIAENEFPEKGLKNIKSILSTVFLVENAKDDKALLKIFDKLDEYIADDNRKDLKILVNWINRFLSKFASQEIVDLADDKLPNLTEVKSMFATTLERVIEEKQTIAENRGEIRGKLEGRLEGVLETAKLMKDGGITLDQIKQFTGLNDNQINNL